MTPQAPTGPPDGGPAGAFAGRNNVVNREGLVHEPSAPDELKISRPKCLAARNANRSPGGQPDRHARRGAGNAAQGGAGYGAADRHRGRCHVELGHGPGPNILVDVGPHRGQYTPRKSRPGGCNTSDVRRPRKTSRRERHRRFPQNRPAQEHRRGRQDEQPPHPKALAGGNVRQEDLRVKCVCMLSSSTSKGANIILGMLAAA